MAFLGIGIRLVGGDQPRFIVAEIGINTISTWQGACQRCRGDALNRSQANNSCRLFR
jgi:hypothetical protein